MAEKGAAGIFGGRLAKTANLPALHEAEKMLANGMLPDQIIRDTGWFRSPADHKWRFEIPDNRSVLKYMPETEGNKAIASVDALFQHPDLFKAYPELKSSPMTLVKDSSAPRGSGSFWSHNNALEIGAPDWATGRSVALHELQHGVQNIEKFSPGSNPEVYAKKFEKQLRSDPDWAGVYDFNDLSNKANAYYHMTGGEVEARNVQKRMNLSPVERKLQVPWATQDVPYANQVAYDPLSDMIKAIRTGEEIKYK